jgi:hypothetical protein
MSEDAYFNIGAGSGIVALVGAIGYGVYHMCLHSRCRSVCCSRPMVDFQVNLENNNSPPPTPISVSVLTPPPAPQTPATRQTAEPSAV